MATNINFPTYGFVDDIFAFSEENWRKYFRPVVFDSVQNGLEVSAGSGMTVNVSAGECRCGAVMGIMNESATLDVSAGHSVYSRIDSIAVQYSYGEPSTLSIVIVQGTPAANPVAPAMAQNFGSLWQMEIAQIEVPANASASSQFTITDKRPIHNSLDEEIAVINAEIDSITSDISAIDTEILSITTGMDAMNDEINSITTDIAGINGEIDSITTDIASLNSDIEGINTEINSITTSIDGLEGEILSITTDIAGIDSQIDSITTDIAGIESEIASITSDISGIEAEILSITTDIDSLSTSKQDLLTFDSAPTEDSTNPVTSGGVFTALSAKADSADLGDLATLDTLDYTSNYLTNKPTLGTMAAIDDASSDNKAYGRKDGAWYDLDGRYYTESEIDTLLAGKEDSLTFDSTPTQNSTNPVTSGGVWTEIDALSTRIDNINNFSFHICTSAEYDPTTYVPTIQNPDPTTFYLVPDGSGNDVFTEWIYVNNAWEIFGTAKVDLSNYVTTSAMETALASKANVADLGDLASLDTIDYNGSYLTNKPTLGDLAALDTIDYTGSYLTNKPTLGALASLDTIDYTGNLITNKPTLGSLADQDTVDYDTEVTNKPTLGALAAKDSVDYSSNEVTNKPTLGTMAAVDDASSDNKAYGRKDGSWYDLDGRYYTESEVDTLLGGKEDTLTFDTVPTASSTNPVESGGVKSALDDLLDAIMGLITDNVETSTTASKAYSAGDFFVKDNVLYKVSADIASGGTITVGTNVVATNLTEQLKKSRFLTRY